MKTISGKQVILLLICTAVLAYGMVQIDAVGDHLQYMIPAPPLTSADGSAQQPAPSSPDGLSGEAFGEAGSAEATVPDSPPDASQDNQSEETPPNQTIVTLGEQLAEQAEEWDQTMIAWSMDGVIEKISFTSNDANANSVSGRLLLFGQRGQELHPLLARYGRLMYPEELKRGDRVIVLDEQLALALFRVGDPIGREVRLGGENFRVIGVVRHQKRVGDSLNYGAYIPLNCATNMQLQLDVLQVEAAPRKGVGADVSFRTVVKAWYDGGTVINLSKEGTGAWLWLRVLGFVAGGLLLLRVIRGLNGSVKYFARETRRRLQSAYALRLSPWLAGRCLLYTAAYALCAGAAVVLMNFILYPVYVFPEWIPPVLIEWNDIGDTFWKVWQSAAPLRELRTPELLRLRFFTLLVDGFSALAGVVLCMIFARVSGSGANVRKGLRAMYAQGAAVSAVRTMRPIAFEDLGYAVCAGETTGKRPLVDMLRIVDVERVLRQLPPSAMDGTFVLEVTDEQIAANNVRLRIDCAGGQTTIREVSRDWDMQITVQALTRLIYGERSFQDFTESNAGFELKMRSQAMDGLFAHHLEAKWKID